MDSSSTELQALRAFSKKKLLLSEISGDVDATAVAALEARGYLQRTVKGRRKEPAYEITQEGKAWLKAQAPKPARRPRAAKPPVVTVADLAAFEARLNSRLDELLARLGGSTRPSADLETVIPSAIRDADSGGRHGGLVPISAVRRLVLERTGISRARFDEVLLDLERRFAVDLKIADDPRRPDAAEGIHVPGRGLIYFVLAR